MIYDSVAQHACRYSFLARRFFAPTLAIPEVSSSRKLAIRGRKSLFKPYLEITNLVKLMKQIELRSLEVGSILIEIKMVRELGP